MGWLVIVVVLSAVALIIPFLELLVVIAANAFAFLACALLHGMPTAMEQWRRLRDDNSTK